MRSRNNLIVAIFGLVSFKCLAQQSRTLYVNRDTSNRFYYRNFDTVNNPDTLSLELSNKDREGFSKVSGSAFLKYLFGDKRIKILDSVILYKLPDSSSVFTYISCRAVKQTGKFQVRIFHSYFERSHSSTTLSSPQSVRFNSSMSKTYGICGNEDVVYEFEVFDESATYASLIGFSPGRGIVYVGYSLPFPKPDQRWERICGKN